MSKTIPSTDPFLGIVTQIGTFRPWYTPNDMLSLGVYGGAFFFGKSKWKILSELPQDIIKGVPEDKYANYQYSNAKNYFEVEPSGGAKSDRTFSMPPNTKGIHPFGWFEWYCRYYYGSVSAADIWRVKQWQMAINQHWFYIINGVYNGEGNKITDLAFLPERRQKLLELGVDPTILPAAYQCTYQF